MISTKQTEFWSGDFGKEYTDRNTLDPKAWDDFYSQTWGITKLKMNDFFIGNLSKDIRILEVGSNTGMQLSGLQRMGYKNLYGIELQEYAVEMAKQYTKNITLIQGSGFDIPFKDKYFDIVCTNGVLIHIAPEDHSKIMDEMYRCSKRYIWGFEYFAETVTDINYRGNKGFLWKADFATLFLKRFPDLKLVKKEIYPYIKESEKGNRDCMYLLEKK